MKICTIILAVALMGFYSTAMAQEVIVEAESATTLNGTIKVNNAETALDGIKAVDPDDTSDPVIYNGTITWAEYENVEFTAAGDYTISALTTGFAAANLTVAINGTDATTIALTGTGGWQSWTWFASTAPVNIPAGNHTIRITFSRPDEGTGFVCNFDQIKFAVGGATSIKEVSNTNVSVFPNPTSTYVSIDLGGEQTATISAYSLTGEKVFAERVISAQEELNVSSFKSGIYLLKIETTSGVTTQKLIIK